MEKTNTEQKLSRKIKLVSASLSKTERKIADYFLDQSNDIAFLSIHDIAAKIDVGQGSIMRFSKKLGFNGFAALKKDIINTIQNDLAPHEKFKIHLGNRTSKETSPLNSIAKIEVSNINHVINNFDHNNFNKIVNTVHKAQNVYTIGFGVSSHLSNLTSYLLRRIGVKALSLNKLGLNFSDQFMPIAEGDTLIAYSFLPYSQETIDAAAYVKKSKGKVIAFTNNLASPIIQHSNINLLVKTDSTFVTNSIGAVIVVIDTLVHDLALRNKDTTIKALNDIITSR